MIIDSHAHLGHDYVFDEEANEEDLLKAYEKYGIDRAIIQPFICRPYIEDTIEIHDRIHDLCKKYPNKFWGMASINPHFRPEEYEKEAKRCIEELGFVAIKITPIAHAVHPATKDGMHVFEVARKLNVPVMVHTGAGMPFSDPVSLLPVLDKYQDLRIILAHAGTDSFAQQALYIAKKFQNVYLEPSWLTIYNTRKMINTLGASKIMFSSDQAINIPVELTKYRTLINNKKDLEEVFSGTTIKVFNLKIS